MFIPEKKKHRTDEVSVRCMQLGLFGVFHGPGLPQEIDLDLAGIFQIAFDLLGDVPGQEHHLVLPHFFGFTMMRISRPA